MEGIIHYELLERNLTVTAERYFQQLRRLAKEIQQNRQYEEIGWGQPVRWDSIK
jgi:hypothetical protein